MIIVAYKDYYPVRMLVLGSWRFCPDGRENLNTSILSKCERGGWMVKNWRKYEGWEDWSVLYVSDMTLRSS